jgi:hypothetical protein
MAVWPRLDAAANHPEVFACLSMAIGLYGVLSLEVARLPQQDWPVAAVGMAGKLLGPPGCDNARPSTRPQAFIYGTATRARR